MRITLGASVVVGVVAAKGEAVVMEVQGILNKGPKIGLSLNLYFFKTTKTQQTDRSNKYSSQLYSARRLLWKLNSTYSDEFIY